jgi:Adenylate kinase and related kinases
VTLIVVSGAPGTGKSTIAAALGAALRFPVLSLDPIKEALADVLGLGGEDWSNQVGDAAAEVVFRLAAAFPDAVAEGWWRGRAGTARWASSPTRPRCSAAATLGWLRTGPRPGSATAGIPFTVT